MYNFKHIRFTSPSDKFVNGFIDLEFLAKIAKAFSETNLKRDLQKVYTTNDQNMQHKVIQIFKQNGMDVTPSRF